jgi:uncharacterized repeat protein (TIGR01451 family)
MRRIIAATGLALFVAGLVSWAVLAGDQPKADGPKVEDPTLLPGLEPRRAAPGLDQRDRPFGSIPSPPVRPPASPSLKLISAGGDLPAVLPPLPAATPVVPPLPPVPADRAADVGAGALDPPGARQEGAVSLEWVLPRVIRLGAPVQLTLAVQNTAQVPASDVTVRASLPRGLVVGTTEPKATMRDGCLFWELGTLAPKQARSLQVRAVAEVEGDASPQAWVTFTTTAAAGLRVRTPRLAVKVSAPANTPTGDEITFALTVSNPGGLPAEQVKVRALLSDGLEYNGRKLADCDIPQIPPGESKTLNLTCAVRARGEQRCEVVAEAEGGLRATDRAVVKVCAPALDLQVSGPALRYLERKAVYTFRVRNNGDAPATGVTVSDTMPAGFKVLGADGGGRYHAPSRQVAWSLGDIPPGEVREVSLEVLPTQPGEQRQHATVEASRGARSEREIVTRVEGLSTLLLEVTDSDDPIELNGEMSYRVRVSNAGTVPASRVKLVCTVPESMDFKGAFSPSHHKVEGKVIEFDPIPELAPRADAVYQIQVKAMVPGQARFKAQLTSAEVVEPIVTTEATRIYSDSAPNGAGGKR